MCCMILEVGQVSDGSWLSWLIPSLRYRNYIVLRLLPRQNATKVNNHFISSQVLPLKATNRITGLCFNASCKRTKTAANAIGVAEDYSWGKLFIHFQKYCQSSLRWPGLGYIFATQFHFMIVFLICIFYFKNIPCINVLPVLKKKSINYNSQIN